LKGLPFENKELRKINKHLNNAAAYWAFVAVIDLVLFAILLFSANLLGISYDDIDQICTGEGLFGLTFYFAYALELFLSEIFGGLVILDQHFFMSLKRLDSLDESFIKPPALQENLSSMEALKKQLEIHHLSEVLDLDDEDVLQEVLIQGYEKLQKIPIKLKEILIDRDVVYVRQGGLGKVYFGVYESLPVFYNC